MKQEDSEQQSLSILTQAHATKQTDGPDEPVVNEEEQNTAVNPEDKEHQLQTQNNDQKKGYTTPQEKKIQEENKNKSK